MKVLYNEIDDYCCNWLSNLMDLGAITPGRIENCSVEDLVPSELRDYDRVHLFAGIGVWEYAFIQSGLDAYSGIWTGSCPCQPFSAAGKGGGFDDERHLWPAFHYLVEECNPTAVLGEQVASKDGLAWLDLVSTDLENTDYAFGAGDLCAAGFGAPHIRQRLYWSAFGVEHSSDDGLQGRVSWRKNPQWEAIDGSARRDGAACGLSDTEHNGGWSDVAGRGAEGRTTDRGRRATGGMAHSNGGNASAERQQCGGEHGQQPEDGSFVSRVSNTTDGSRQPEEPRAVERVVSQGDGALHPFPDGRGPTNGFWRAADWLRCRDDKWRPVEPGTFPLADGASSRVGRLRAYGNAIVAPQAIEFCGAVREFIETINSDI